MGTAAKTKPAKLAIVNLAYLSMPQEQRSGLRVPRPKLPGAKKLSQRLAQTFRNLAPTTAPTLKPSIHDNVVDISALSLSRPDNGTNEPAGNFVTWRKG